MSIFLLTSLFTLPVFLFSPQISLIQAIIKNNNPGNHSGLIIITHEICIAPKIALPELNYSKKTIPHDSLPTLKKPYEN
jgi:hypothetical protein